MINYSDIINHYPDFPKPGIDFIDILPFLSNKEAFKQLIADIDAHTHCPNVATVEARGFLFAAPLLTQSKLVEHIIPIRKKGKLPYAEGDLHDVEIMKEYGADHVYYRLSDIAAGKPEGDTFYLTFFDDILANAKEQGQLRDGDILLSSAVKQIVSAETPEDVPTEVVELLVRYYYANKQDDNEWVVLPVTNFDAYFGNTNFSRKWWNRVPDSIIVKQKQCYGVCRYSLQETIKSATEK